MQQDYFQCLSDALVCRIFGQIGALHEIAPCRLVCRRWESLYRALDYLDFVCDSLMVWAKDETTRVALLESFIGRTIGASTCGVRELHVTGPEFGDGAVCIWLRAVRSSVESLTLVEEGDEEFVFMGDKLLEIFKCSLLKEVTLSYYQIDGMPIGAPSLQRLKSFTLTDSYITDRALEDILSSCPSLNFLDISDCSGLTSPYLHHTTLSDINLFFPEADPLAMCTLSKRDVKDPKVQSIHLHHVKKAVLYAPRIGKITLDSPSLITLTNMGTIDSLFLDSNDDQRWGLQDITSTISGLKNIEVKSSVTMPSGLSKIEKVHAGKLFGCMTNWTGLEIGCDVFECLRKRIQGEIPELGLRKMVVDVRAVDERSLEVLEELMMCCPKLEKLSVKVVTSHSNEEDEEEEEEFRRRVSNNSNSNSCCIGSSGWMFANGLLKLQRRMKNVNITCD